MTGNETSSNGRLLSLGEISLNELTNNDLWDQTVSLCAEDAGNLPSSL